MPSTSGGPRPAPTTSPGSTPPRFSGDWWHPWSAGTLPPVRVPDAERRLADLGLPILLLHGRQDMTFPASLATQAAAHNPAARAVILDEAGHMAHIDQPDAWLAALTDFLGPRENGAQSRS